MNRLIFSVQQYLVNSYELVFILFSAFHELVKMFCFKKVDYLNSIPVIDSDCFPFCPSILIALDALSKYVIA